MGSQPSTSNKWTVKNCNDESVQICINKAEAAFLENDFDKAERLMKKAYRMFPDMNISLILAEIQAEKEMIEGIDEVEIEKPYERHAQQPNAHSKRHRGIDEVEMEKPYERHARQCVQLAEEAYNMKNFDKAERLLLKAHLMDPTEYVKSFLVKVRTENQKFKYTTIPNEDAVSDEEKNGEESTGTKPKNQRIAEEYINEAVDAEQREHYYVAEIWLMQAEHAYPTDIGKLLLETVRKKLSIIKPHTTNSHEKSEAVEEDKMNDAEKCIQVAEVAFSNRNFEKAERMLLKAERIYPTTLGKQLLKDVQIARGKTNPDNMNTETNNTNDNDTGNNNAENKSRKVTDKEAAESCITKAKKAIAERKFLEAKRLLEKSVRLNVSDEATQLIEQVEYLDIHFSPTKYRSANREPMLGNKDDAEKCIQSAENAIALGKLRKAEDMLKKAERLCPTFRAKDLLRQIGEKRAKGFKDTDGEKPTEQQEEIRKENERRRQSRQDNNTPKKGNQENARPRRKDNTQELIAAVQRVKAAKDDYEILGVGKNSPPSAVKKAYKRLTLMLHPDKNKTPGAKEAFMLASEAAERLTKKNSVST